MFTKFFKKEDLLEKEIEDCLRLMKSMEQNSDEYLKQAGVLEKLYKMRKEGKVLDTSFWSTVVTVGGSILGILIITNHERLDIITSKAMSFVVKGRV